MISKTLGLSQNIAGVTFLAFGNTSADIFAGQSLYVKLCLKLSLKNKPILIRTNFLVRIRAAINGIRLGKPDLVISVIYGKLIGTNLK